VPNGFSLKLITSQGLYSTAVNEAQAVQDQLGKIGIKVNVETLLFPGVALVIAVIGLNVLGDSLRAALDPRTGGR